MQIRTTAALAAAAVVAAAGTANASVTINVTSGSNLFTIDADTGTFTETALSDSIIAQTATGDGTIQAFSNTDTDGTFEVYTLTDPLGTPSLTLVRDDVATINPTYTFDGTTLWSIRGGDLFTADPTTFALSFVADLGTSGDGNTIGASAYDPVSGNIFFVARDNKLYSVDPDAPMPVASAVGTIAEATGATVRAFNHGGEIFDGVFYVALQDDTDEVMRVGTLDTTTAAFTEIVEIDLANRGGLASTSLSVIPAPGTAALAGLAGLVAARRRRD